jgi:membrane protein
MRERLGLALMADIATNFVQGRPPWTLQQLTERVAIPMHAVNVVLDALQDGGLLARSHDDPPAYLPARDLAEVSLADVVTAIRRAGEDRFLDPECLALPPAAEDLAKRIESAIQSSLQNVSVKALVAEASATPLRAEGSIAAAAEDRVRVVGGTLKS